MLRLLVLLLTGAMVACAADWPMAGFDLNSTNNQPEETALDRKTVSGIKLLWRKHLGDRLSSPVILGRLITHRGFQELAFVSASDDTVSAVDVDLGRILWQRTLGSQPNSDFKPVTPALAPSQAGVDGNDDGPAPIRPLFVLSSHGNLFALRTISGENEMPPHDMESGQGTALKVHGKTVAATEQIENSALAGSIRVEIDRGMLKATRDGRKLWHSSQLAVLAPPIIANGLVYLLAKSSGQQQIEVLELETGAHILAIPFDGTVGQEATLALANGHLVFTTQEGYLYCYGLPIDL